MPFSITNTPGGLALHLEGGVTIRDAHVLSTRLREAMEDGFAVSVETRDLEDIDTCILQLLYSLRKTAAILSFDNPSEVFLGAADRCGLRRELLSAREAG